MEMPIVIDFETEGIEARPKYPPVPTALAIKYPGKKGNCHTWGHPSKNNSTFAKAKEELRDIYRSGKPILCQNAKFDLDVADVHMGLRVPTWDKIHDTMFLLFLHDPHSKDLSLKPAAEKYLGMKPEERDAVRDWLVANRVISANENHGAHISKAPGDLVGKYAVGDVERTAALYKHLLPKLDRRELGAYDRERKLIPILLENERGGMYVDVDAIRRDLKVYRRAMSKVEEILRKKLKAPNLDLDNDKDVGDALHKIGAVREWVMTKGSATRAPQRSVSKANMTIDKFADRELAQLLMYRNKLQVVVKNNMEPWLEQAEASGGKVYTQWNQVRHHEKRDSAGARSGRITCGRWLNITKSYVDREDRYEHPKGCGLPSLPLPRKYLLPDPGEEWSHEDFRQQEFKIVAHYAGGELLDAYRGDPNLDYHDNVRVLVEKITGQRYSRRDIKAVNFGILYGEGLALLAKKLMMDIGKAAKLKAAVRQATPGVAVLDSELKRMGKCGEPIRTWGGRRYYCEPPSVATKGPRKGELVTWEYKLLNYLAQGSAADATKEAIIRYHDVRKDGRMLVTVYDEINISNPKKAGKAERKRLREAMESLEFDVKLTVDEEVGPNWGELEPVE